MNIEFLRKIESIYKKEDDNLIDYDKEKHKIEKILSEIEHKLKSVYAFVEPIGRGGSGIVIKLIDKQLQIPRALKIPRPKTDELIESIKNEIDHLKNLKHDNIINLYALGEVKIDEKDHYPFFVMDFIEDAIDIKKKLKTNLSELKESKYLANITKWLLERFIEIASAISFCHSNEIIHFDIKPSNILLTKKNKSILSDLGLSKKKTNSTEKDIIGFTIFYAHPDLKYDYAHKSSKNFVKKYESPSKFNYKWDIYAFGKTILELLSLIDQQFPDSIMYDYTFNYLHLLACRMLDGRNLTEEERTIIVRKFKEDGDDVSVFKEEWLELKSKELLSLKYESVDEIIIDLMKMKHDNTFYDSIPELNIYYSKRIQSSDGITAPFSKRVKRIIEHPVFSRLSSVPQLGLLSSIYPTASHNRLEHSIGVFRNCVLYINALYHDSYNPLFRQLVTEVDLKTLLIVSLLHDIGHYPLAHEIEETNRELKHEIIGSKLLSNNTEDKFGHTIKDIIENKEWGWGIEIEEVRKIIFGQKEKEMPSLFKTQNLKHKMLSSIIDGPIDIDKVDFLIRDSKNCHLKYGEIIDFERLLNNLTIIIYKDDDEETNFSVGSYEKGQTAAESLTFARYLLYQSLYWHHTARSIRVMLSSAVSDAMQNNKSKSKVNFVTEFYKLINIDTPTLPITIDDMLNLISKNATNDGKELINLIKIRSYYKRIFTVHHLPSENGSPQSFLGKFRTASKKSDFNRKLQDEIKKVYHNYITHTQYPKVSLKAPEITDFTLEKLSEPNQILCDAPEPSFGTTKNRLRFIPEPQRLLQNYTSRQEAGNRVSDVWKQVYFRLMEITAKGRVYCHPQIRDNLMAVIGPEELKKIITRIIE